MDNRCSNLEM